MKDIFRSQTNIRSENGFTFVELITVIVIIGILALSVSAKYTDLSDKAERTACLTNQLALESAQRIYYAKNACKQNTGSYAGNISDLLPFLNNNTQPKCPAGGTYILHANGSISCTDAKHGK